MAVVGRRVERKLSAILAAGHRPMVAEKTMTMRLTSSAFADGQQLVASLRKRPVPTSTSALSRPRLNMRASLARWHGCSH
jgi:hypothetical protein